MKNKKIQKNTLTELRIGFLINYQQLVTRK